MLTTMPLIATMKFPFKFMQGSLIDAPAVVYTWLIVFSVENLSIINICIFIYISSIYLRHWEVDYQYHYLSLQSCIERD